MGIVVVKLQGLGCGKGNDFLFAGKFLGIVYDYGL